MGGGVIRKIFVSGEYHGDSGVRIARTIVARFSENREMGTCCLNPGKAASFAPNQIVRSRTRGVCGCTSLYFAMICPSLVPNDGFE
jgi:hypothetical protein